MLLEPLYDDGSGEPYYLRWRCHGCGCHTVPVAKALLDANDERAISKWHRCQVCGHAVQLPHDLSSDDWNRARRRAEATEGWLTLDDEPPGDRGLTSGRGLTTSACGTSAMGRGDAVFVASVRRDPRTNEYSAAAQEDPPEASWIR